MDRCLRNTLSTLHSEKKTLLHLIQPSWIPQFMAITTTHKTNLFQLNKTQLNRNSLLHVNTLSDIAIHQNVLWLSPPDECSILTERKSGYIIFFDSYSLNLYCE